ncbi:MAG TPA: hypothetical protein DCQ06_10185 [Myxococcales bacterium]|nr:hypothetical protein [Myxococcales bacterium]
MVENKVALAAKAAQAAAGLHDKPAKTKSSKTVQERYRPKLVKAGQRVDFSDVKKAPQDYVGKTLVCSSLLAPAPMALSPFLDKQNLQKIAEPVDDRRTTCFCRTQESGLKSTPVTVYFPKGTKGALLHIDRSTEFNLEVKDVQRKQVFGLFRGIVKEPRKRSLNPKAPDLLSALVWPEDHKDTDVICTSTLPVVPADVQRFDSKATKMVGVDVAPKKARVRCEDRRGGSVSVDLYFASKDAQKILTIGRGSAVSIIIKGFNRNQVVALFDSVKSGAVVAQAGDLKAVLLDVKPHLGKELACTTRIAPAPSKVGMLDRKSKEAIKEPTADYRANLLCGETGSGVVNVRLFFKKGEKEQFLKIGQDTKVRFSVWGAHQNALIGLFSSIDEGAVKPGGAKDWRRISVGPAAFVGKKLACKLALAPFISKLKIIGSQKKALVLQDKSMSERHGVLTCANSTDKIGGTRIEVYFPKSKQDVADKVRKGDTVEVKLLGSVYNSLIAAFVRRR